MALKHAKAGEVVDLRPLGDKLKDARTAAIIKEKSFEAVRLIVPAGREIPSHQVSGNITLHCLEGRISLGLTESEIELSAGDWVYLGSGEPHLVKGIEDSSLLLTILFDKSAD
jgi:quercetin dioxygenase-like cupin family protein